MAIPHSLSPAPGQRNFIDRVRSSRGHSDRVDKTQVGDNERIAEGRTGHSPAHCQSAVAKTNEDRKPETVTRLKETQR